MASRRLQLCRSLFERIIERDAPFGRLLSRVKIEYESALAAAQQPPEPKLEAAEKELARAQRDMIAAKTAITTIQEENSMLRQELSAMMQREQTLREEIRAYQEHAYEMQQAAVQQAEAEQAAINAELERELPPSARPGDVTHRLGGEMLLVETIPPPPPRPSNVPQLDMGLVYAKKDADAKAEAEEEKAREKAEGGHGGGGHHGDEDEDDDEDDDDEDEGEEMDEEEMARLRHLHELVASGKIDLSKGIPPELMPGGVHGERLQAALEWSEEDLKPRTLQEGATVPSQSIPGQQKTITPPPPPPGSKGAVPAIDMSMLRDPKTKPEGYHDEFARETKGVAYDARTAAVDAQMYAHDPEYAKAAAEAREANKAAKEALAKEAGKA